MPAPKEPKSAALATSQRPKLPANNRGQIRFNSVKHGLLTKEIVLSHLNEKEVDWIVHLNQTKRDLRPVGYVEEELTGSVAETLWRLRRVRRYWAAATEVAGTVRDELNASLPHDLSHGIPDDLPVNLAGLPNGRRLAKVMEVENHLHRVLTRHLDCLSQLQNRRKAPQMKATMEQVETSRNEGSKKVTRKTLEMVGEQDVSLENLGDLPEQSGESTTNSD